MSSDVLGTALEAVKGLPPLSLTSDSLLSSLAIDTLNQVSKFLADTVQSTDSLAPAQGEFN